MKTCLSGATLKWIAMISMLIDHFTAVFFEASVYNGPLIFSYNTYVILRGVGRLAFPIYFFLLVEGFLHTRSVKKYLLRLFAFRLLLEWSRRPATYAAYIFGSILTACPCSIRCQ